MAFPSIVSVTQIMWLLLLHQLCVVVVTSSSPVTAEEDVSSSSVSADNIEVPRSFRILLLQEGGTVSDMFEVCGYDRDGISGASSSSNICGGSKGAVTLPARSADSPNIPFSIFFTSSHSGGQPPSDSDSDSDIAFQIGRVGTCSLSFNRTLETATVYFSLDLPHMTLSLSSSQELSGPDCHPQFQLTETPTVAKSQQQLAEAKAKEAVLVEKVRELETELEQAEERVGASSAEGQSVLRRLQQQLTDAKREVRGSKLNEDNKKENLNQQKNKKTKNNLVDSLIVDVDVVLCVVEWGGRGVARSNFCF